MPAGACLDQITKSPQRPFTSVEVPTDIYPPIYSNAVTITNTIPAYKTPSPTPSIEPKCVCIQKIHLFTRLRKLYPPKELQFEKRK